MKEIRDMNLNEISDDQLECVDAGGDVDDLLAKINAKFGIPSVIINAFNKSNKNSGSEDAR